MSDYNAEVKMKIKSFFGILLLLTVFSALSCTDNQAETKGINDSSLARIIVKKELVVGVDPTIPPLSFYSSGKMIGYEVDVAQAIADKLGVQLRIEAVSTSDRISELENRAIDYIASGFINNETNAERFSLSTPYLRDALIVVVYQNFAGETPFRQFSDLRNRRIGMLSDQEIVEIAAQSPLYINNGRRAPYLYSRLEKLLNALDTEQLDAVVMNLLTFYSKITIEKKRYHAIGDPLISTVYSYAFRKEDKELTETVNMFLADMAQNGTLKKISEKWFGIDVSIVGRY